MKRTLLYIGSVVVLILAAITFIFIPGMSQSFARGGLPPFGKYDGKKIEYAPGTDFANAVAQYAETFKNQGQELNQTAYYYIYSYAFNQTIVNRAFIGAVNKAGFGPGDKTVNRTLSMYYADENGNFSKRRYNAIPESERKNLRNQVTQNLKYTQFQEDNFGYDVGSAKFGGIKPNSKELDFIKKMGATTKSFDLAGFDTSVYPEEKVLEYANKNADLFKKYDLSVITMDSESKLKGIVKQIENNELTFNDALNTYSEKFYTDSEGKLSNSYKHRVLSILEKEDDGEKIFAGKVDEVSPIVKTKNGYSVFRTNKEVVEADFTDKDILNDVQLYINANEAGTVDEYYLEQGKDFVATATTGSFDDACNKFKLTKKTLGDFQVNYGSLDLFSRISASDFPELSDAETNDNFMKIASSLKENEVSEPIKIGKYIVVLKMTGEKSADVDEAKENAIPDSLKNFDSSAADAALFDNPKVENNVSEVYFKYFANND